MLKDEWQMESIKLLHVLEKAIQCSMSRLIDDNNEAIEKSTPSKLLRRQLLNILRELEQTQLEREVLKALGKHNHYS